MATSAEDIENSVWKQASFGELEGLKVLVEVFTIKIFNVMFTFTLFLN